MSLPPHLLALQNKLNNLNIPKLNNINKNISLKEEDSSNLNKSKIFENNNILINNSLNNSNIENKKNNKNKKTNSIIEQRKKNWVIYRKGAGIIWEDDTLKDWSENDYRIFCRNLDNEVST